MLHISSTHQMQQIHPNDLTLICPYVGVLGVGVRCSLSETGSEQAKKTQPVNGNGQFSKKYGSGPPPQPIHLRKALFKGFPNIPHIPLPTGHSVDTNEATMAPTLETPQSWQVQQRPREICATPLRIPQSARFRVQKRFGLPVRDRSGAAPASPQGGGEWQSKRAPQKPVGGHVQGPVSDLACMSMGLNCERAKGANPQKTRCLVDHADKRPIGFDVIGT